MAPDPTYLWRQTGVVYQIYPSSFQDTTGDGIGDLQGILLGLDYLSETLGVAAIWLSSFYPSPMVDFGYDVADYTGVDPLFGELDTFDQLVAQAHLRRLRVIIDLVPKPTEEQSVGLPVLAGGTAILSTHLDREVSPCAGELCLRANEGVILELS